MATSRKKSPGLKELSVADKAYVETKRSSLSPEQLAQDTGKSVKVVQKYLDSLPKVEEIPANQTATGTPISSHAPIVREEDGVAVQTAEASQWADEVMKRNKIDYLKTAEDRIFRPRPGKPSR